MKQFLTVFKFELLGQLKNKIAIVITAVIVITIGLILTYPRFNIDLSSEEELKKIAIYNSTSMDDLTLMSAFGNAFPKAGGYDVIYLLPENDDERYNKASEALYTIASGSADITSGLTEIRRVDSSNLREVIKTYDYDAIIEITGPMTINYIASNIGIYDFESSIAAETLKSVTQYSTLLEMGIPEETISELLTSEVSINTVITGKDQTTSFMYTYVIIMVLYFVLLIYANFIATSVAGEKSSRAMEVLITSAKPTNLMFGKVLGSGCAGLIELLIILGSSIGFYKLNENVITNEIVSSTFNIPMSVAICSIVFFILGYFIYAFMYGAVGSLASRSEDVSALVTPVMVLYMATFLVAIIGMNNGSVNELYFKVLSFLPTFAPMLMIVRISMGEIAVWEVLLSVLIQIASIIGLGVLCSKIYRAGVLMYGNTPKPKDIWKIITSEAK